MFDLKKRICLITGSYRGIGKGIAESLGKANGVVIINGRNAEGVHQAVERLKQQGIEACGFSFDITDREAITANIEKIEHDLGSIDVLINNAGMNIRNPIEDITDEDWDRLMNLNIKAVLYLSQGVGKRMVERKKGKIIMIGSLMCEAARPHVLLYAASKGAVKMMVKSMAVEWGRHNIQVNGIGPGYIETEMTKPLMEDKEFNAWVLQRTPAGRWGTPEDVGGAAVFLASDASDFINGQMIYVDGGWLAAL